MTVPFQYNFLGLQLDIYGVHISLVRWVINLKVMDLYLLGKCCYLIHPPKTTDYTQQKMPLG